MAGEKKNPAKWYIWIDISYSLKEVSFLSFILKESMFLCTICQAHLSVEQTACGMKHENSKKSWLNFHRLEPWYPRRVARWERSKKWRQSALPTFKQTTRTTFMKGKLLKLPRAMLSTSTSQKLCWRSSWLCRICWWQVVGANRFPWCLEVYWSSSRKGSLSIVTSSIGRLCKSSIGQWHAIAHAPNLNGLWPLEFREKASL